jgi:protocatechuate 3,4-dioxygenase beta subunit
MKKLQSWILLGALALACHASAGAGGAAAPYTGKVVDGQGRPVAEAVADCYRSSATNSISATPDFALQEHVVTDSRGGFTVPSSDGTTLVVVKKEGLAAGWKIFGSGGGPAGDAVVLTTPSPLAGLVVDGDGQPVEDAEVWVSLAVPASESAGFSREKLIRGKPARDTFNARTTADGRFRIANFPANTQADLSVRKEGRGQRVRANLGGALAYISGQQAIKLTLNTPGSIEGKVTVEGTGAPLAGVKLRWLGASGGLAGPDAPEPALSGTDGAFRIADVAPGEAAIAAEFAGEPVPDWVAEDVLVTVAAGETMKDVQVRASKGGVVTLTVFSQNGRRPLANAYVYLSSSQSRLSASAETGADGAARLRVPVGSWSVVAGKEGWNTGQILLTIAPGQSYEQETYLGQTLKVAGTVRDASGAPVAGAKVSVTPSFGNNGEVETDAGGRYEIKWQPFGFGFNMNGQSQPHWLMARSAERNLVARHAMEETTANLDLVLQPGLTLSATVQDASGNPVANAMGYVTVTSGGNGFGWMEALRADASGRMEVSGVLPAESYTLGVNATGYGSASKQIRAPSRPTNLLTFPVVVLPKANQKLSGQVLGPNGKPLAGANVNMQGEGQPPGQTTTDAQGRFSFEAVCEGPVRLFANSQGGAGNFMNGNFEARGGDTNVVIRFAVNGQGGGPETRIVTTSGRVLDAAGAPVAGARLSVLPAFGMNTEITSEDDGKYSVAWQRNNFGGGQNPFIFVHDTERHLAATYDLEETTSNLDLRLQPALTLSVKAQDAQGNPISNATGSLMIWTGNSASGFGQTAARADDQGVIEFHDLPPERHYSATLSARGYGSATVQAQAGQTKTNHFTLRPAVLKMAGLKLAGQVVGPDNKPVARAYVNMNGDGQPNGNVTTDATGHFSFDAVCEGRIQLSANSSGNGGPYQYGNAEAQGGDTNVVIHFGLNGGFGRNTQVVTTSGKIMNASGAPVGGASLSVLPVNGMAIEVKSDPDGTYSITWQKNNFGGGQNSFILARDTEHHLAVAHDLDGTTTNLDLRLQPALTISVKAKDAEGKPIPSATANVFIRSGNNSSSVGQMPDSADDQGVIEFPDLPQERGYSATISAKGYGSVTVQAQAGQTKTTHFDFPAAVLKAADRKLAGKVLGPDSKPVAGANVNMQGEGQPFGQTTTDAAGHFSFDAVCEGSVRLFANHQGDGVFLNGDIQTQGGDTNVVIRFGVNGQGLGGNARVVTTSGKIMDASGAPVGKASLSVMPVNGMAIEVKSDPDGTYSITWQKNNFGGGQTNFLLVRDTERHLAVAHDLDETTTNLDLRLQPALTLSVKAQDAQGKPISSATASLSIRSGNSVANIGQMPDSADDQGVIEIADLPQERSYSATIMAKGYGSATVQAQATDTKTTHFDFPVAVLKVADHKLAGKVLGPDSKPVAGANVNMQGDGQPFGQTTTDASGHFSFDAACEGPVHLFANSQGGASPFLTANTETQGGDTNAVIRFTVNNQGGGPNSRTVTTSGRVLSPTGAPVPGALLSIVPGNGINMELKSDADGKYSITWQEQNLLPPPRAGTTPVRGTSAGPRHLLVGREAELNWAAAVGLDDQTTNVDLHLQEALTISGSVKDPDGGPVKNATVRTVLFSVPKSATVDAQGAFSIGVLPQGQQYNFNVIAPGYGSSSQRVQADEAQTNRLVLPPFTLKVANLKLAGQVVDADGQPVAGARVMLQGEGQPPGSATTDAKGRFAYESVCEGEVVLSVTGRNGRFGGLSTRARTQARGGDTNVVVKLGNN